ncbi:MAG: hypothetical protein IKW90_13050 [Lachnospiraceae bacterium]|nr:hypothetical protein [Lachnospiraceae bacterium]
MFSKNISINKIYISILGYLYLPVFIFLLGWTAIFIALPVLLFALVAIYYATKKIYTEKKDDAYCNAAEMMVAFGVFFLFFVMVGHSDLFAQDFDWHKHHAVFNDLMNYDWPVVYKDGSLLTYYLGQYIVPSFLGKVFNSSIVMTWSIPLWNAIGLTLVYSVLAFLLKAETKKKKISVALFMLLWGGCTELGTIVYHLINSGTIKLLPDSFKWIDIENIRIHFASNYDALYGAFQHVIVPWLVTCFFLGNRKHVESYVMIALPLLFSATFAFVYFVPVLIFFAIWNIRNNLIKDYLKSIFGIGNMFMLPLAGVFCIYFAGNVFSEKPGSVGFELFNIKDNFLFYLVFILTEFLLYSVFLFKRNAKNPLLYVALVELLIIPFFKMGLFNDLCSRGSIPARFILMFLCLEFYFSKPKRNWRVYGLSLMLALSVFITGGQIVYNFSRTVMNWNDKTFLADKYKTLEGFSGNPDIRIDEAYNYFTPDYQQSLFYYIGKK